MVDAEFKVFCGERKFLKWRFIMGFRFRKSIKIAPGVRLNIGKISASISVGGRGVRHTISSTGWREHHQ
jgi:hypothetical protein